MTGLGVLDTFVIDLKTMQRRVITFECSERKIKNKCHIVPWARGKVTSQSY